MTRPRLTPGTDPDAVLLPATWAPWTEAAIERAWPVLRNLARIAARIAERKARETDAADDAA